MKKTVTLLGRGTILAVLALSVAGCTIQQPTQPSAAAATSTSTAASPTSVVSGQNSPAPTQGQSFQMVSVTANGFEPATLTIKAGQTVEWTNNSGNTISINSDDHPTHLKYPPLNLGIVQPGATAQLKFDTPGSYGYHNHLDPSQKGTVVVE